MNLDRIIIFKPGPIGDFLHSLPVVYALKKKIPASSITMVTGPELRDLVEGNPFIDDSLYIPSNIYRDDLPGLLAFIKQVRTVKADLFVDLKSNVKSFLIRIFSGSRRKVSYKKQREVKENEKRLHAIENLFETIFPITGRVPPSDFQVYLRENDETFADSFLLTLFRPTGADGPRKPIIALNPNVSIPRSSRHWPPEYFAQIGDRIRGELGGEIVLIGGPEDRSYLEGVASMTGTKPVITAGKFTLGQTGALLKRCDVLISGDTGPMHLAASVGTKVIALFGSMDPRRAGPYGRGHVVLKKDLPCVPCEEKICPLGTTQCMVDISVDEVFQEVRKILVDR